MKSIVIDSTGLNTVQIDQAAIPPLEPIKDKKRKRSIVLLFQIIAGFMLSILLVYIKNILKSTDENISNV